MNGVTTLAGTQISFPREQNLGIAGIILHCVLYAGYKGSSDVHPVSQHLCLLKAALVDQPRFLLSKIKILGWAQGVFIY